MTTTTFPNQKETANSCHPLSDVNAQTGFVPKVIEIPDEEFRKTIEDSLKGGHLDNPGQMGRIGVVSCSIGHRIDKDGTWRMIHK